jgi:diguanylate cyclase (GGDEF)-like protein
VPSLDPATLLIASCATTLLVSLQFVVAWRQSPGTPALGIWAVAHFVGSTASVGLALRGTLPDWLSVGAANAAMIAAYGVIWAGIRSFERRPMRLPLVLTALSAAGWCALCLIPAFYESIAARVIYASLAAGLFCAVGARDFWLGRRETLQSRRFAVGLLALYSVCYLVRIPAAFLAPLPSRDAPLATAWVAILCLAAMLFSIASSFTFIGLAKERAERQQRLAARTDLLTGIANRRAFLEDAQRVLPSKRNATLLLFDLDRFKAVNDRFGHEVGDAVLVGFCAVAGETLPETALFGRLGGEEFACLLVDVSPAAALETAESLRRTFSAILLPELPDLRISVSVGVAQASPDCDFTRLLRRADGALYAAKARGRNRIECDRPSLRAA